MGWVFEVAKMFLYLSFPVGIYHYVNQPAYFDKWVIQAKKEYFPTESKQVYEQMENFIYDFNVNIEKKHLDALERQSKNKQ
ncbi:PREDICTED: protein PET100 homolog, mitochondrial [Cyphomyrmex costatus]|nr:PREDICTED: protein PET100 homolog, mitochondrial [Cyphomyrmex costatus]